MKFLNSSISEINGLNNLKEKETKILNNLNAFLEQCSKKIVDSCLIIEQLEGDFFSQTKVLSQVQHHVNKLELELRTQGDIS